MASLRIRSATAADAGALARGVVEGVADYAEFAGPGWTPPLFEEELEHARELLADERVVALVAERDGEIAAQITVLPATRARVPVDDPALGHVSNLFVRKDVWGSGLARRLHAEAVELARERGLTHLRLFVAEGQARARRFYEREGWVPVGEPFDHDRLGLRMIEYRYYS